MSDASTRQIGGLTPRAEAPSLSRLVKANRDMGAAPEPRTSQSPKSRMKTATGGGAAEATPKPGVSGTDHRSDTKIATTVYITTDLRTRSRAAFKATQHLEGDASYSEMINKAIAAEVERRENEYNSGAAFAGGNEPLPMGRPLAD